MENQTTKTFRESQFLQEQIGMNYFRTTILKEELDSAFGDFVLAVYLDMDTQVRYSPQLQQHRELYNFYLTEQSRADQRRRFLSSETHLYTRILSSYIRSIMPVLDQMLTDWYNGSIAYDSHNHDDAVKRYLRNFYNSSNFWKAIQMILMDMTDHAAKEMAFKEKYWKNVAIIDGAKQYE